ncbi:MAG TPA: hypothetical protein EYN83_03030 [Nitrospinaceae bacterium]|nr:hypothetical protein [Nitrospinaceae bacterium]HIB44207.1 hypothetical protein [Nitrospina sp.]HIN88533.1 hypothetical protein [Nitrospinaceae bacterium]
MNYFTTIEQFFLSLKGSGLTLSASDYQLIGEWESRNIPVELICRAIENGYSRFEEQSNRRSGKTSLIQIQAVVEQEIQEEMYKQ